MKIIYFALMFFMVVASVFDLKRKRIPVFLIYAGFGIDLISIFFQSDADIGFYLLGIVTGIVFLLIGLFTKEAGTADGLLLIISGLITGIEINLEMLLWALFFTAVYSIFLITFKKKSKKYRIAFIPFLTIGLIITFIHNTGGIV